MDKWNEKNRVIKNTIEELDIQEEIPKKIPKREYYHYTSLEVLFSILNGDSFWISNVRFSNDSMEERMLAETKYQHDDYILCLSDSGDRLSQWRGYCHEGGAAIEFNMRGVLEYSILHSDYDSNNKYEIYENAPLPVIYADYQMNEDYGEIIKAQLEDAPGITLDDMLPFVKNAKFREERESRMVFLNREGSLSQCIRFRKLSNGVMVPYMVVKHGNIGKMLGNCVTKGEDYDNQRLEELVCKKEEIWIEEGANQEKIFYEINKRVEHYAKEHPETSRIEVFCKGHLPIRSITVAPTYDRERVAEQIKRFCMSKYWLRNVEVRQSDIPYIQMG